MTEKQHIQNVATKMLGFKIHTRLRSGTGNSDAPKDFLSYSDKVEKDISSGLFFNGKDPFLSLLPPNLDGSPFV